MSDAFRQRLDRLHHDIVQQGQRVEAMVERAFESVFDADRAKAEQVIKDDDLIDRVDIEIEKAAVELLALGDSNATQLRMVLTIVKVNNELERIADLGAGVAELVVLVSRCKEAFPPTLRVTVNSVIGMIRDANMSMRDLDSSRARQVLASDDLVEKFSRTLLREVQEELSRGACTVDFASAFWTIGNAIERMADHTTNIAEQVIYVESGQIVRHLSAGWSEPMPA
ncbi:MAG: phosphate signaling complex protein PhoU [Phycisphaerales bacterium]|nr:phosphate signaling complex protein PhoU [Phycisphaerales bacterium]